MATPIRRASTPPHDPHIGPVCRVALAVAHVPGRSRSCEVAASGCLDIASRPTAKERRMTDEEFKRALEASREIELTVTGRTSGREMSNPV